ncbi:MAG: nucleotidyltransferase family protein [Caldilineaceae bacterium]|nr:nucleotidyltransferase family protein [Caldilineaceae bacterium]
MNIIQFGTDAACRTQRTQRPQVPLRLYELYVCSLLALMPRSPVPHPQSLTAMPTRTELIERKNEVIRELAAARRRLASASPQQRNRLEAEIGHLQAQERELRLTIDRTPIAMSTSLQPKSAAPQTLFDAVITAGYDRNKVDPLAAITGQPQKVLLKIAGAPMIWHVVRALDESKQIGEIVIVGLDPKDAPDFGRPIHYIEDQGGMTANQRAGAKKAAAINNQNRYVLAMPADAPLLTGEMIRWFIDACRPYDHDIYWGIVKRSVMEATFPNSKRSYLRLREGQYCSGDLFLLDLEAGLRTHQHMERFFASRKSVLNQVRMLGFGVIFNYLIGRLSLKTMLGVVERELGATGAPIIMPFAEAGMDVDKPHHLEAIQHYLAQHPEHPAHART